MNIGGFQRFSMIDYPDKVCAIVFTTGCNFRCPYCHNPELVEPDEFGPPFPEEKILSFLTERKNQLEGVVITGGEPTIHGDLLDLMRKIRGLGMAVKLDTNGSNPDFLGKIIAGDEVNYIAMDIKAPLHKYEEIVQAPVKIKDVARSISLILKSDIPYEFRTTVAGSLLTPDDILDIGETIRGARRYILQKFLPTKTLDPDFLQEDTWPDADFERLKMDLEEMVEECVVR